MRAIRTDRGETQEQFAAQLGVSRKTLIDIENQEVVDQRTENAVRWLDPLGPAFTVGGQLHGRAFWAGRHQTEMQASVPNWMPPFVRPGDPGTPSPKLVYRYSGVTLPETGERIFVPADEDGWDEARAHAEGVKAVLAWQAAAPSE
ncbi:helix-turn-helix transcriptional regulator [Sphingomonas leidyi]|uniref:helix-turn-helix transcriptional regulator n=1 Tax=Sphingomonas leidyi TaxID=68569 RepID=UPI0036D37F23